MKKIIGMLVLFASTCHLTFANTPNQCPSVAAIQAQSSLNLEQEPDGTWFGYNAPNRYDTDTRWTFGIGEINANNQGEALQAAKQALAHLRNPQGPVDVGWYDCIYSNDDDNFVAIATTHILE